MLINPIIEGWISFGLKKDLKESAPDKKHKAENGARFFSMEHEEKTLKKSVSKVKSQEELTGKPEFCNRNS